MIKNYLTIALRNLQRHSGFSAITIFGLGLGIGTCLLIVTWVVDELSFDRFHQHHDRLYRSSLEYSFGGQVARTAVSPTALLPAMLTLPEVQTGTRFFNQSAWSPFIVRAGDNIFTETKFCFADSTFFDVFSFTLLKGNAQKALSQPYQVLLTESTARKYFGDADPVGQSLQINNGHDWVVTGVLKDTPDNSFLQFDFVASFVSLQAARTEPIWWSANYMTFVVLHPGADAKAVEEKSSAIAHKAVEKDIQGEGDYIRYNMMLMKDLHLHSDFANEPEVVSSIVYVYLFAGIAILVLVIASINYINLTTAKATERAREVGVRKVAGARRKQLFFQFMAESAFVTFAAFIVAITFAALALPLFNDLTGKHFSTHKFLDPDFLIWTLIGIVILSVTAGVYPAMIMASFRPMNVLKGSFRHSSRGLWLRRSLVVVQFTVSVVLIVGTLVILKQLDFLQDKRLGFDKENVLVLPLDGETQKKYATLKTELLKSGAVQYVSVGSSAPAHVQAGYSISLAENTGRGIAITGLIIDQDYIPAMGMELLYGENFSEKDVERFSEGIEDNFILNEIALRELGVDPASAVGRQVVFNGRKGTIKAVVKNFHFASLHHPIKPLVMFIEPQNLNKLLIRLSAGNVSDRLATVERITSTLLPHRPFEYSFLDEDYAAMYTQEQRMGTIFTVFAMLAIVIASLGLLGLVAHAAVQKTREIGIRKVLGASASGVVLLLTKDFAKLVTIGILIGIPASAYLMNMWLEKFAYRTNVGIAPMVIATLACLLISFATAAFHAVKASMVNPAETLRSE